MACSSQFFVRPCHYYVLVAMVRIHLFAFTSIHDITAVGDTIDSLDYRVSMLTHTGSL